MKQKLLNHIKNIGGWTTKRKLLVINVDDYGAVRVKNKESRDEDLSKVKSKPNRFDYYDCLENDLDLEALFDTLTSVKDSQGKYAVFTPFTLTRNLDFDKLAENEYQEVETELISSTFKKLSSTTTGKYSNTWSLWTQGLKEGIFLPQFHGREHLNINVLRNKLKEADAVTLTALKSSSYMAVTNWQNISFTSAYNIYDPVEAVEHAEIILQGTEDFNKLFGYAPIEFMPPSTSISAEALDLINTSPLKFIGRALLHNTPVGYGRSKKSFNYLGKKINKIHRATVRNVVFEPTDNRGLDWVNYSLQQIEAAFTMKKPAIISSHRVNFVGGIDERNRTKGLGELLDLLRKITKKWPDVEFLSSGELHQTILQDYER